MKKLLILLSILLCSITGVKSQVPMTVAGWDQGSTLLAIGDYWTVTYIVKLYNNAHTEPPIQVWQGSLNLSPCVYSPIYYNGRNNPFTQYCPFTMNPAIPDIANPNFRVLVGVKRWSVALSDYVCGYEKYSGWMNSAGLLSPFTVSGILVDP